MESVLPNNFAEIEQEEIMYLYEGNWLTFRNNVRGLANAFQTFRLGARDIELC